MFKLPIEYHKTEKTPSTMITDLELVEAVEGPSMLQALFSPKTALSKQMLASWAAQYTQNKSFLRDTVVVCKRLTVPAHDPSGFVEAWDELHKTEDFNNVYQYVDYSKLSFLNSVPKFLLLMTVYSLLSPVLFILSPLMVVVMPFILLKMKNTPITWTEYYAVLKQVLRKHALGGLLIGFKDADMQQRGYMVISAGIFVIQLYSNVQCCYQFYKHITKTHQVLRLAADYLTHLGEVERQLRAATEGARTYDGFMADVAAHMEVIHPFLRMLQTPFERPWNTGVARQLFYQMKTDKALSAAIKYTFGLHGFAENMSTLGERFGSKEISACWFSSRTEFKGMKYPLPNYRKNNVAAKNYMITGPNASGKTTFIKAMMLNVFFTQIVGGGYYTKGRLCPYKNLCCYINIPDTSGRDSLFQAEARRCKEILATVAKGRTFCIFDELFSGTNPLEASASAYAFLQELVKTPACTFLLTTHFIDVCERTTNVENYHMETVNMAYTYAFKKGISYVQGGIQVLTNLKFPPAMIECAKNYR
jgi:hypothetical protein